jgi:hypothetical protein
VIRISSHLSNLAGVLQDFGGGGDQITIVKYLINGGAAVVIACACGRPTQFANS